MSAAVITPAAKSQLTTVQAVRDVLGYTEAAQSSAKIGRLIDAASGDAVRVCNRVFGRQTYRERLWAWVEGCGFLLEAQPVVSIASLTVGDTVLDPDEFDFDGTYLRRAAIMGAEWGFGHNSRAGQAINLGPVVEYVAGWVLPSDADYANPPVGAQKLPGDIEKAVIDLIGVSVSDSGRDMTVRSENVEGVGNTSYLQQPAGAMLPHAGAESVLLRYRRHFQG